MLLDRSELGGGLLGGLLGGIGVSILLHVALSSSVRAWGDLVGSNTLAAGAVVLLATSLLFGVGYAWVVTRYVDQYISTVLALTTRSDIAKGLVMPLTNRFGMALVVTVAMGLLYGLGIGIGFGGLLIPGVSGSIGFLNPVVVVGYALYGVVLGGTYGHLVMG